MTEADIRTLAEIVRKSSYIVFFGGAGVSTESGLRDYRSEDGIYSLVDKYGGSPEELLSHDFFVRHTDKFYRFYRDFFLGDPLPNAAHNALAELEQMGKLKAVITQNIDGLHQQAGSKNVVELHGTTKKYFCTECGEKYTVDYVRSCEGVPMCQKCGSPVKPDVVLYGEMLHGGAVEAAIEAISNADTLIVGGTSLAVYPAAGYLGYFKGKNLILINKSQTGIDSRVDLLFRDSIGTVLSRLMEELK